MNSKDADGRHQRGGEGDMAGKVRSAGRKFASVFAAATLLAHGLVAGIPPALAQVQTISCPTGFGALDAVVLVRPILLDSLKVVPNPVIPRDPFTGQPTMRGDLVDYVANLGAAIQLGKALFWDMQVGSDGKTACATCHNQAGADGRNKNQMNPGANGGWDGYGPNYGLFEGDFPFTRFDDGANLIDRTDNAAGSQGVRNSSFVGIRNGVETTTSVADPVFSVNGTNVRRVTGVNTPSAVNAVFNHRQFWNGRAQPEFNGVNPWGNRDISARVWVVGSKGTPVTIDIHIQNASLASQAVGPVLNPTEMSAANRKFPDVGQKMLAVKPLNGQKVSPSDSVLGPLADVTTGLKTTYTSLIQQAFQPKWWNSNKSVSVGGKSYSMMAANFSLFWGLAVMLYEATLVSDNSPMDQYLALVGTARPGPTDATAAVLDQAVDRLASEGISVTRETILNGLALFERPVAPAPSFPPPPGFGAGCTGCHFGGELTSASLRNLTAGGLEPGDVALKNAGFDIRMERMFTKMNWTPPGPLTPVPLGTTEISYDPTMYAIDVTGINGSLVSPGIRLPVAVYDAGWYNLGVRPTAEDPGLGGQDPFGAWLSWTRWFQSMFASVKVPGGGLGCATSPPAAPITSPFFGEVLNPLTGFPLLAGPLKPTETTDVAGTFKVPGLHNVELTGPYFHNGGKATLKQVVAFYDDGGNFDNPTRSPLITPLGLSDTQMDSLVAFLLSLTDERVRWQKAPFDHPQLFVPNGDSPAGTDALVELPAVGASGSSTPLGRFLNLNPFEP
jgi:cytochrome c peroxidase